jgi:hypothetical protein
VQEGVDQHFVAPGGDTLVDNGIQQEDPHGLTALQVKSLHTGVAGTEPIQPTPGIDEQQSLQTPPTEQPGPELETQQPDPGLATQKPDPKPETPKTGASSSNPVPSGTGGRHRQPDGGLTDALKSATDQTNSSISKVTGALTGKAPSTHPAPSTPDDTKKGDTAPGAKPNDANE